MSSRNDLMRQAMVVAVGHAVNAGHDAAQIREDAAEAFKLVIADDERLHDREENAFDEEACLVMMARIMRATIDSFRLPIDVSNLRDQESLWLVVRAYTEEAIRGYLPTPDLDLNVSPG